MHGLCAEVTIGAGAAFHAKRWRKASFGMWKLEAEAISTRGGDGAQHLRMLQLPSSKT